MHSLKGHEVWHIATNNADRGGGFEPPFLENNCIRAPHSIR